jgi:hypothetical protein
MSLQDMHHRYLTSTANLPPKIQGPQSNPKKRLSRGSFYTIASTLTSGDEKLLTAVDYVTGILVHDPVDVLQDMVEDFSPNTARRDELTRHLEIARTFLKVKYHAHACINEDTVPTHGLNYGLNKGNEAERTGKCVACDFVPFFLSELRAEIQAARQGVAGHPIKPQEVLEDAEKVLDDIEEKFYLYQGHCVRVANQQMAIKKLLEELEKECLERDTCRGILITDWKMKFEACSSRETTQQHFGKRGMSWHGCLFVYFRHITHEDGSVTV